MLKNLFRSFLLVLLVTGLQTSAGSSDIEISKNLLRAAREFNILVGRRKITAKNCKLRLKDIYQAAFELDPRHFEDGDIKRFSDVQIKGLDPKKSDRGKDAISYFFEAQVRLHGILGDLIQDKEFSSTEDLEECARSIRVTLRTLRSWQELWGLQYLRQTGQWDLFQKGQKSVKPFAGGWPHLMVSQKYKKKGQDWDFRKEVRAGDMLLSRGTSFTGAIISRIGATDNQFSHLAIVDEDPNGKLFVVESIPKTGVQRIPLDEYLHHGASRLAMFRFKHLNVGGDHECQTKDSEGKCNNSAELSKLAGQEARKHVGKRYNYSMDMGSTETLFCSQLVAEVIRAACEKFSCDDMGSYRNQNLLNFPLLYTVFQPDQNPFVKLMDINIDETFAPADVELDPRLDLVADWRSYGTIPDSRRYDMVATKIFQWIEKGGYRFSMHSFLPAFSKWGVKHIEEIGAMQEPPPGMVSGSLVLYFLMMHTGTGQLGDQVSDMIFDDNFLAEGSEYHDQLMTILETYGKGNEDVENFINKAKGYVKRLDQHVGLVKDIQRAENCNLKGRQPIQSGDSPLDKKCKTKANGYFLTDRQINRALERTRQLDCDQFKKVEQMKAEGASAADIEKEEMKIRFHDFFRPDYSGDIDKACSSEPLAWDDLW